MRIATWNLESTNRLTPSRRTAFLRAMAEVDADVWVLTETWVDFSLGAGYRLVAQSCAADDLQASRRWVAIWSRFDARLLEVQSQPDRMVCGRIEQFGQRDVVVVGTVLPWPSDERWRGAKGYCAALSDQVAEWGRLWGTPRTAAFSVAGDFNQSLPHQKRYGSEQGGLALTQAIHAHDLLCPTHGNDLPTGKPRIDHVCVSRSSLKPLHTPLAGTWPVPSMGNRPITDHAGVYTDIQLLQ